MLSIQGLEKSFDGFMAVSGARLEVKPGEIVAVSGPNGAGKTTLFHLITGQLAPDRGTISFKGKNIAGMAPFKICRRGISRSYQVVNIFNRLTVFENVQVAVLARQKRTFNMVSPVKRLFVRETEEILESVGLADKARRISGSLSHGDQKVLEIAVALGNRPELLILDEPTAGMSPEETETTLKLMQHLSTDMGLTLLFCEHDIEIVFSFAHRIMVMQQGATLIQDTPEAVKCDTRVQAAYLGGEGQC